MTGELVSLINRSIAANLPFIKTNSGSINEFTELINQKFDLTAKAAMAVNSNLFTVLD